MFKCRLNYKKIILVVSANSICIACIAGLVALSGCRPPDNAHKDPRAQADKIAEASEFKKSLVTTQSFSFTTYQKFKSSSIDSIPFSKINKALTIYIEGDGRSWISRTRLSQDPTPHNPLALKLAILDPSPMVAYLARPCQYTPHQMNRACTPEIWSDLRFSETVISNMNQAVEQLKKAANANQIHLVGFSGGAAIAVLIAARREDIASLRTVGGDLDHASLSEYHKTTPLYNSLNPKAVAYQLTRLPQLHFVGEKDAVVPRFISQGFIAEVTRNGGTHAKGYMLSGATHHEGWEEVWPELLKIPTF